MRYIIACSIWIILAGVAAACSLQAAKAPVQAGSVVVTDSPTTTFLPIIMAPLPINPTLVPSAPTAWVTSSLTPTITPQPLQTTAVITAWSTYTDPRGVTLEYPTHWQVLPGEYGSVTFRLALEREYRTMFDGGISVTIYDLPLAERAMADPSKRTANSLSTKVYWSTPITVGVTTGWLVVIGFDNFDGRFGPGKWDREPLLDAEYYNEQNELAVQLMSDFDDITDFDDESTIMAQTVGLAETVAQRHSVFDHMLKSVRFPAPPAEGQ